MCCKEPVDDHAGSQDDEALAFVEQRGAIQSVNHRGTYESPPSNPCKTAFSSVATQMQIVRKARKNADFAMGNVKT